MSPRTGRPKSDNPKGIEVKARIDAETDKRLQAHCEKYDKTRTDVVREGIELVLRQEK
ncbi:MAG: CopG family transcriptional regulator [Oscillospiraceae bacterium]|nr:CopG family transcriptional regulator [Oscillospiraceae bacterium]